jgi:hypothetical protein|tara:strand:+ start:583 stop:918 length:336 start_codon:yes stop_codon:yes gene_type:complete
MRLLGRKDRHIDLRKVQAAHTTEEGIYNILELAYIQELGDKVFALSGGVAVRKDEMTEDEKKILEGFRAQERLDAAAAVSPSKARETVSISASESDQPVVVSTNSKVPVTA